MAGAYAELDHPADIWLEIHGRDLPGLFENALYAFYSQIADLEGVRPDREIALRADASAPDTALRDLLTEALYRFETEGFVGAAATVRVDGPPAASGAPPRQPGAQPEAAAKAAAEGAAARPDGPGRLTVTARVWGETADRARHSLLGEVKAITYHRLAATRLPDGGWRATVLLDV